MRKLWIYIFAVIGLCCVIAHQIVNAMGGLTGIILQGSVFILLGVFFILSVRKHPTSSDKIINLRNNIYGIIIGLSVLILGSRILFNVGMDLLNGPEEVILYDCNVYENVSLKRIFHTYYLKGTDVDGNIERFRIGKEIFDEYKDTKGFTLQVVCWKNSGTLCSRSNNFKSEDEQVPNDLIVNRDYLLKHSNINNEDLEGVDVDAFIREFDLKESNIEKVNLEFLLEMFRKEESSKDSLYVYLTMSSYASGAIRKEDVKGVRKAALYIVDGTYQETLILDGETQIGYWGKGVNLFVNMNDITEQISYTDEKEQIFKELLKICQLDTWKEKYAGTSENTTGSFGWILYLELSDDKIYRYSGNGVQSESTPEQWDFFVNGVKGLFL